LLGNAGQFAQSWYNTFGNRSGGQSGGGFDYYRTMGLNPQPSRFTANSGALKWR